MKHLLDLLDDGTHGTQAEPSVGSNAIQEKSTPRQQLVLVGTHGTLGTREKHSHVAAGRSEALVSDAPIPAENERTRIQAELDRLPSAIGPQGIRLLTVTIAFLASPHWQRACALGWTLSELFGLDPLGAASIASVPDTADIDGIGLIPWLALCRPGRLIAIEAGYASIVPTNLRLQEISWSRAASRQADAWWHCPAIIVEDSP